MVPVLGLAFRQSFRADGYAILDEGLDSEALLALRQSVAALSGQRPLRGGVRGVLEKSVTIRELANNGPPTLVAQAILGPSARPVTATLFDKSPSANWKVPWHQDLTIAVAERREVEGFGPWSVKDGVPHVQPPASVLEAIVAIRVHLDATGLDNGALRVLPGSHLQGKLDEPTLNETRSRIPEVDCPVGEGGLMVMAPLLLHASSACAQPSRRRVLHLEYAATPLPGGLEWAW